MTPAALRMWLDSAKHGDAVTYHTGGHAIGNTCALAGRMSDLGEVSLVQRRRPDGGFDYVAQRIKRGRRR